MTERVQNSGLQIEKTLHSFIGNDVLPGLGIEEDYFWNALAELVRDFGPKNRERCWQKRDDLQAKDRCVAPREQRQAV